MVFGMLGREAELRVISHVLNRGMAEPAFLCIVGEAGIGKTTLLEATRKVAHDKGFAVLSCAPAGVEAQMSYAGLTDLLLPLADRLEDLPEPQRLALEAALLRRTRMGRLPDVHTVGAGTLSLLAARCAHDPVLLTVDDVQWLDEPSLRALIFAVRRCRAPYALVVTLRDGYDPPLAGLVGAEEDYSTLRLEGLALAPMHELLGRSGQVFDRPTMKHLLAVSHGNPLFARELARSLTGDGKVGSPLPSHLSTAMRSRYLGLPDPTRIALLMCSALADPTAATLQRAGVDDAAGVLAAAEADGILTWRGDRVGFSHPMWREVVYRAAGRMSGVRSTHGSAKQCPMSRSAPDTLR